ncbi:hypothetical protein BBJ28_00015358 [Nothophytophthora sp. Chile5]|nr:hypothetical protein BBJ28_00015358 [Nothophytophthora sp. Chile5]
MPTPSIPPPLYQELQVHARHPVPGTRDLIPAMLCVDPNQRMTVEQALQHPWLKDVESVNRNLVYRGMAARQQVALAAIGASS